MWRRGWRTTLTLCRLSGTTSLGPVTRSVGIRSPCSQSCAALQTAARRLPRARLSSLVVRFVRVRFSLVQLPRNHDFVMTAAWDHQRQGCVQTPLGFPRSFAVQSSRLISHFALASPTTQIARKTGPQVSKDTRESTDITAHPPRLVSQKNVRLLLFALAFGGNAKLRPQSRDDRSTFLDVFVPEGRIMPVRELLDFLLQLVNVVFGILLGVGFG